MKDLRAPRRGRLRLGALGVAAALLVAGPGRADGERVSCLGRIEPGEGVIRIAGPSANGVVTALYVAEGDWVDEGQLLAELDDHRLRKAEVVRLQAEVESAERSARRARQLSASSAASEAKLDEAELGLRVARADLEAAQARLALSVVRAPLRAQVLDVHTRPGERVSGEGILELGQTDRMYAVAEVYETDVPRVREGQRAEVRSPALGDSVSGVVEVVGLKVGRVDVLGTDPVAKTDARVVEVRILLDEPARTAALTHLQVEVEIGP